MDLFLCCFTYFYFVSPFTIHLIVVSNSKFSVVVGFCLICHFTSIFPVISTSIQCLSPLNSQTTTLNKRKSWKILHTQLPSHKRAIPCIRKVFEKWINWNSITRNNKHFTWIPILTDTSQLGKFYNLCINTHKRYWHEKKNKQKKKNPEQNESEKLLVLSLSTHLESYNV